jgi:biopolymer transport protein ExbD
MTSALYANENSILIQMDLLDGHQVIYVGGEATDLKNLLNSVANQQAHKGRNAEVTVLFNQDLSFSKLLNVRGIIEKVGFLNIKYFYLGRNKTKMAEIEMKQPAILVPFELN